MDRTMPPRHDEEIIPARARVRGVWGGGVKGVGACVWEQGQ